ncbi:MAG: hypothetical protein JWM16_1942, partial [Verrucomicrobiales bacterium]|nr:hypothetical protein [Verrucomicrobiales bacterium]
MFQLWDGNGQWRSEPEDVGEIAIGKYNKTAAEPLFNVVKGKAGCGFAILGCNIEPIQEALST